MSQPQPVGGSGSTPSHKKRNIIIACAIAALIIVGASGYLIVRIIQTTPPDKVETPAQRKVTPVAACSTVIIEEANAPLAISDQVALGKVVNKITAIKDYDKDPNCLYIVLQYALASGDASASKDLMEKLDKVYNSAAGFSKAFTVSMTPITTLRQNVAFVSDSASKAQGEAKQENDTTAEGSEAADKFHKENQ